MKGSIGDRQRLLHIIDAISEIERIHKKCKPRIFFR
jgi:hypothetical protein